MGPSQWRSQQLECSPKDSIAKRLKRKVDELWWRLELAMKALPSLIFQCLKKIFLLFIQVQNIGIGAVLSLRPTVWERLRPPTGQQAGVGSHFLTLASDRICLEKLIRATSAGTQENIDQSDPLLTEERQGSYRKYKQAAASPCFVSFVTFLGSFTSITYILEVDIYF
jgi:hypothetical protein